jgi:5-methylcytosine-specific restriction endonuclease McrA
VIGLNKAVYKAVMQRTGGYCENCGQHAPLSLHHAIYGKGKRQKHETIESCFGLCWHCHQGAGGVHHNRELDIRLKLIVQDRYREQGKTEEEIRELMGGRIYFGGDAA